MFRKVFAFFQMPLLFAHCICMLEVLVFEFLAESQRFHKFVPFIDGVIGLP